MNWPTSKNSQLKAETELKEGLPWGRQFLPQELLIPLEVANEPQLLGISVSNRQGFPAGSQDTILEFASNHLQKGLAGLTIHNGPLDNSLQKSYIETLVKLADSIDHCDSHTSRHHLHTSYWARMLAQKIDCDSDLVEHISLAARVHDVGKVAVPHSIFSKPMHLNDEEWQMMKRHPAFGANIMEPSPQLQVVIPMVRAHHERFDGSGYPLGLSNKAIPLGARIISIADAFTAMTDGRSYRTAESIGYSLQELRRCSGSQFDPELVKAMIDLVTTGLVDNRICSF